MTFPRSIAPYMRPDSIGPPLVSRRSFIQARIRRAIRVGAANGTRRVVVRLRLIERITLDRSAGRYSQRTYSAKSGFRTYSLTIPCASNIGYVVPNMYRRTTGSMTDFDPP